MTANRWQCIAQTGTFDSSCSINVAFGTSVILFSVSVRYGISSINIGFCNIDREYKISVRLRETESSWAVDMLCNKDIEPSVTVANSPYWISDYSPAGSGNIVAVINDITSEFNTEKGSGSGDSYWKLINTGTINKPIYTLVPKDYEEHKVNIASYGDVISGGITGESEDTPSPGSVVSYESELISGTPIGTIYIDGVGYTVFAPSALPNPHPLVINGTTYDGSKEVEMTISGGGGGESGDYLPLTGGVLSGALTANGTVKAAGGSNGSAIALMTAGYVKAFAKTSGDSSVGFKFYTNDGATHLGTPAGALGNDSGVKRYYYGGDYNSAPMYIFPTSGNATIGGGITDEGVRLNVVSDSFNVAQVKRSREGSYGAVIKFALADSTLGQIGWTKPDDFTVRDGDGNKLIEGGVSGMNINADIVSGEVTSGSDIRYKNTLSEARIDIEDIANAPIFNYKWKDNKDNRIYLGSSAQYWYDTAFGNGVKATNDESKWSMAYGPIALASAVEIAKEVLNQREQNVELAKEVLNQREQINVLKKEIQELKERLKWAITQRKAY